MKCFNCGEPNQRDALTCVSCGASLRAPRAKLYLDEAEAAVNKGNYEVAAANLTRADQEILLLTRAQRQEYLFAARAFWLQGSIYYSKGEMEAARAELLLAQRDLESHSGGRAMFADVLNRLGNIDYLQGRIDEAIVFYERSSEMAMAAGAHVVAAKVLGNLSNIVLGKREVEQATIYLKASLEQAELGADVNAMASVYRNLASLHGQYGPIPLALEYAAKAVTIARESKDPSASCMVIADAARLYLRCGDIERAEAYLRETLDLAQSSANKVAKESITLRMAELMREKGNSEAWLAYIMSVLNSSMTGAIFKAEASLQLVEYYISRRDLSKAQRQLQQIRDREGENLLEDDAAFLERAEAKLNAVAGDWEKAAALYQRVIDSNLFSRFELGTTWQDYGTMLLQRGVAESDPAIRAEGLHALKQAALLYRQVGLPNRLAEVEVLLNSWSAGM